MKIIVDFFGVIPIIKNVMSNKFNIGQTVNHLGQTVSRYGVLGTITAITANARTGKQETIIVRFVWSDKGHEFKTDDRGLSIPEVLPSWMNREGDALNISDRD